MKIFKFFSKKNKGRDEDLATAIKRATAFDLDSADADERREKIMEDLCGSEYIKERRKERDEERTMFLAYREREEERKKLFGEEEYELTTEIEDPQYRLCRIKNLKTYLEWAVEGAKNTSDEEMKSDYERLIVRYQERLNKENKE